MIVASMVPAPGVKAGTYRNQAGYVHINLRSDPFKAPRDEGLLLIATDEDLYYSPAYIGPRGWVGLRLDSGDVDWTEVTKHVAASYCLTAPKRLAARVGWEGS
jgi:hypothetical protein